jgi:hypothetical protein
MSKRLRLLLVETPFLIGWALLVYWLSDISTMFVCVSIGAVLVVLLRFWDSEEEFRDGDEE